MRHYLIGQVNPAICQQLSGPVLEDTRLWLLDGYVSPSQCKRFALWSNTSKCSKPLNIDRRPAHTAVPYVCLLLYFHCERVARIGNIFLKVLRIFDPQFSFQEVLDFSCKEEHPQLYWFIALTLFYIDKNKKKCSSELYRSYMWTELETLKMSKHANDEMLLVTKVMLELLDAWGLLFDWTVVVNIERA